MKNIKWLIVIGVLSTLLLTACGNAVSNNDNQEVPTQQATSNVSGQDNADSDKTEENTSANQDTDSVDNGSKDSDSTDNEEADVLPSAYFFTVDELDIHMNDEMAPIIEALGEPNFYYEAASCAFEGMDRIYTYNGFEIYTYMKNDIEYVFSVVFTDDSRTTREGAGLGTTLEELEQMYGTEYEKNFEQYTYYIDDCRLSFILEEGAVISVEYYLLMEE